MHPLLSRQLRKHGLRPGEAASPQALAALLDAVARSYADVDQERYLLERSQELASREMAELNGALRLSEARMASLLALSSDWIWEQDELGRFTFVSAELMSRTGVPPEAIVGQACTADGPLRMGQDDLALMNERMQARQPFHQLTFEVASRQGSRGRFMRVSGAPVFDGGRFVGYRGVGSDVTERVLAERKILELARYDALTGLANRAMFMDEFRQAIARALRAGRRLALFFIDLDRFKYVNDTLGHAAGDFLLQTVASRLTGLLREADLVARLGGDEFVVITEGHCEPATLSKVASRVIAATAEPLVFEGHPVNVSASVGIAVYPDDGDDPHSMLRAADTAMYQAKSKGKNTFEFFTGELASRAALHFQLEAELRAAVENPQWVLHWQPQVDTLSGRWVAAECLIRWLHPQRGLLPPSQFITLAEESGHIVAIGRWAIEAACRQFAAWREQGIVLQRCAVNVSVRQLYSPSLIDEIDAVLKRHDMAPDQLELEVTESLIMADPGRALATLDRLHTLGVQLAVDDFGTGYSSLGQLKRIPGQTLKIDRTFVDGLPDGKDDLAITRAVVAMGRSLGMRIVGEGVETPAQRDCLASLGVDQLQGYLFSRPLAAEALTPLLRIHAQTTPPAERPTLASIT